MAGKKGRSGTNGKGKTKPKRSKAQRALDLIEMTQLIRRGHTLTSIAEKQGVHLTQISYDWKQVLTRLKKERSDDAEAHRQRVLEQYGEVKREAWGAWEKSLRDAEKRVEEEVPEGPCPVCDGSGERGKARCDKCAGTGEVGGIIKIVRTLEGRVGDPRFLNVIETSLAAERELLGVDAPKRMDVRQLNVDWDVLAGEIPLDVADAIEERIREALPAGLKELPAPPPVVEGQVVPPSMDAPSANGHADAGPSNGEVQADG